MVNIDMLSKSINKLMPNENNLVENSVKEEFHTLERYMKQLEGDFQEEQNGLSSIKIQIEKKSQNLLSLKQQLFIAENECLEHLETLSDDKHTPILKHFTGKTDQEQFVMQGIMIYIKNPVQSQQLVNKLVKAPKELYLIQKYESDQERFERMEKVSAQLNRYLIPDMVVQRLARWCEASFQQSRILRLAARVLNELNDSQSQYQYLNNCDNDRVLEQVIRQRSLKIQALKGEFQRLSDQVLLASPPS